MKFNFSDTQLLLDSFPGAVGYKDKNSNYIGGNQLLASYMGYKNANDIIGLSDLDIKNEMSELAPKFIQQDQDVLSSGMKQHIDIGNYANGDIQIHLSTKKQFVDRNNEIIGTVFTCVALQPSTQKELYKNLLIENGPGFFSIGAEYDGYDLSTRESECLFYVVRGYTAKEIGKKLSLSSKTIEYYTEQLKNKLACSNRAELIEKAIHLGFILNIPLSIISNNFYTL